MGRRVLLVGGAALGAALLGLPLERVLGPLTIAVVLGLCLALMLGANRAVERLFGIALGLVIAFTAWGPASAAIRAWAHGITARPDVATALLIGLGLLLIAVFLLVVGKAFATRSPERKLPKPTTRARAHLVHPEPLESARGTSRRRSGSDDLGLTGGGDR